jgi:hypothetical protein
MDVRWTGRDLVRGNQVSWDDVPPADLRLRLDDVLQYEGCTTDDLWEAIRDWMESRGITRSRARPLALVPSVEVSLRENAVAPVAQSATAMQLTRLVYASKPDSLDSFALESIRTTSLRNNARDQVTGVLVVEDNSILQLIEGRREAIAKCFARIIEDSRHHDVQVISCGDVSRRLFQDWNMRLVNVSEIKREILSAHCVEGRFQPGIMSEFAVEEFCRALAVGGLEAGAR